MNKNIISLAKKSGLIQYESDGKMEEAKKFAEMIVQECADIITSQDVDPAFKNRMAWAIKQHFGVE